MLEEAQRSIKQYVKDDNHVIDDRSHANITVIQKNMIYYILSETYAMLAPCYYRDLSVINVTLAIGKP